MNQRGSGPAHDARTPQSVGSGVRPGHGLVRAAEAALAGRTARAAPPRGRPIEDSPAQRGLVQGGQHDGVALAQQRALGGAGGAQLAAGGGLLPRQVGVV